MKLHNLSTVLRYEYIRTINKPTFWVATLAIPVILAVVVGLMALSGMNSQEAAEKTQQELTKVLVIDDSGVVTPEAIGSLGASGNITDKQTAINEVKGGKAQVFFYYPKDLTSEKIEVYTEGGTVIDAGTYGQLAKDILKQSAASEINDETKVAALTGTVPVELKTFNNGEESNLFAKAIAPGAFLVLFYFLVIMLSNQMLNSTTEEKENRTVEMILTTLRPRTLILGKMLAIVLAGATQALVILSPIVIALVFFRHKLTGAVSNFDFSIIIFDPERIFFAIAYFATGFMIFTALNVIAGALAPSAKEAGAFYGVSVFSMFVPFYAIGSLVSAPDALVTKVFTYFPLTQPVTLLIRNAAGNMGAIEQWVALAVAIASATIGIGLAVRAFRFGALEYNRKLKFIELLPGRKSS